MISIKLHNHIVNIVNFAVNIAVILLLISKILLMISIKLHDHIVNIFNIAVNIEDIVNNIFKIVKPYR